METKPDTIKITASHREEIFASHANLYVTVKGSSIVSGKEALRKAREVSELVEALARLGLPGESVQLQGAAFESASGALLKSSSARYHLKIRSESLEQIAELLDIIAGQKNATLERIEWKYPEDEARDRGLQAAIARGKTRAENVSAALGVKLLGIYDFTESTYDEERPPTPFQAMEMGMKARAATADQPGLDMDIQHSKTINVNVEIWYRISAF